MALWLNLNKEPRSNIPEGELVEIGRKPYRDLTSNESRSFHNARPGDLRVILESAMQDPPNLEQVIAVSAICGRAVMSPRRPDEFPQENAGYWRVGEAADNFLAGQQ